MYAWCMSVLGTIYFVGKNLLYLFHSSIISENRHPECDKINRKISDIFSRLRVIHCNFCTAMHTTIPTIASDVASFCNAYIVYFPMIGLYMRL